jgi:hypothetical protein
MRADKVCNLICENILILGCCESVSDKTTLTARIDILGKEKDINIEVCIEY